MVSGITVHHGAQSPALQQTVTIESKYLLFYWETVFPCPKGVFLTVTYRIGLAHDTMA
jgi:hypothetical protein